MSDIIIEAFGIRKSFPKKNGSIEVLKGIDLKIERGDFLTIMGPSGAGKSTLLHILGTLDRPTEGEIRFENRRITDLSEDELSIIRNEKIGFVFQFYHLLEDFSVLENIAMPLLIRGIKMKDAREKLERILAFFGLTEKKEHRPFELSGGEQQKVAIARALICDPKVIFADEPTGNLDRKTGWEIVKHFVEVNERFGTTIVLVTHDPEIGRIGKKRFRMLDGEIFPTSE
ncbi:MAG: ABC transporter ATP-binding protein [Desulfobacterota bacterium]|nr:ABC transporter ATP-binding protein [Thermodesulfobacteriota bacterium]MDW8001610.1 ABC transporter ATP-binding protein [Deltaproteobacteria bacterium]